MSRARERFRQVLTGDRAILAANIFDSLSARIAEMLEYEVCVLSGSVGKATNLAVPDQVVANSSDLADHCHRITRAADVSLMVDAEDGFGNAVNVMRTVKELEGAGVSGIEIEDNAVPPRFGVQDTGLVSKEEQMGKLRSAVAARTDPTTVIVARTSALGLCPLDEALDRIKAYSETGAGAVMLVGLPRGAEDIEAVHQVTPLPLCVLNPPQVSGDAAAFLASNNVRILMLGNPTYAAAVKAIHDTLHHLKGGGSMDALQDRLAPQELLRKVIHTQEFVEWQQEYLRS